VNTIEFLLLSMRNLAMSGHLQAAKWLSDYRAQVLPDAGAQRGYLVVPEIMPTAVHRARDVLEQIPAPSGAEERSPDCLNVYAGQAVVLRSLG
jgi:hypothetical protein